jgi:hypothetical protein
LEKDRVKAWFEAIFENGGTEVVSNMLCLAPVVYLVLRKKKSISILKSDIENIKNIEYRMHYCLAPPAHAYHERALFALQPGELSEDVDGRSSLILSEGQAMVAELQKHGKGTSPTRPFRTPTATQQHYEN